jgi:hypothetical protein
VRVRKFGAPGCVRVYTTTTSACHESRGGGTRAHLFVARTGLLSREQKARRKIAPPGIGATNGMLGARTNPLIFDPQGRDALERAMGGEAWPLRRVSYRRRVSIPRGLSLSTKSIFDTQTRRMSSLGEEGIYAPDPGIGVGHETHAAEGGGLR